MQLLRGSKTPCFFKGAERKLVGKWPKAATPAVRPRVASPAAVAQLFVHVSRLVQPGATVSTVVSTFVSAFVPAVVAVQP